MFGRNSVTITSQDNNRIKNYLSSNQFFELTATYRSKNDEIFVHLKIYDRCNVTVDYYALTIREGIF